MRVLVFIMICACFLAGKAQPPSRFYTTFGGNGDDIGYSAKPTLDRQYIIAGSTTSYGNGYADVYLVKLDSMGTGIWEKYYGGFGNDVGKSVIQLPDSGYVIAGFTNSFGAGGYDAYVIRTDKNGNMIWQRTFGGLDWDFADDLVQGPDGGLYIVGNTSSFGNGKKDGFVIKFDPAGNQIFQKFIGGAENEELRSIIKTNDNFLATVGYTESRGDIDGDGYFLKLDLNGDTLFTRKFGGPYKDFANDVVQKNSSENNEYVMCGAKTYTPNGKSRSYMYRISPTGNFIADSSRYHSTDHENYVSLANSTTTSNLTGFLKNIPVPNAAIQGNIMVQYPNGYEFAINSFGGTADETFYSIEGTKDGGYIMVGSTLSFGIAKDVFFIKIDDGVVINYSSLVGTPEHSKPKSAILYYDRQVAHIYFQENEVPETISIYDLNGKILKKLTGVGAKVELDLSGFAHSLFVLQFEYNNGYIYHEKLINR